MKIRTDRQETPIKDRIRKFVSYLQMSDRDFQNMAGLGEGFMVRQSEPGSPAVGNIIESFPQVSPDWLLTGTGQMIRTLYGHPAAVNDRENIQELAEPTQPYRSEKKADTITIPMAVWEQLRQQLENKDAQIATLLTKIQ